MRKPGFDRLLVPRVPHMVRPPNTLTSNAFLPNSSARAGAGRGAVIALVPLLGLTAAGMAYIAVNWLDGPPVGTDQRPVTQAAQVSPKPALPAPSRPADPPSSARDARAVEAPLSEPPAVAAAPAPISPTAAAAPPTDVTRAEPMLPLPPAVPQADVPAATGLALRLAPFPEVPTAAAPDSTGSPPSSPELGRQASPPYEVAATPAATGSTEPTERQAASPKTLTDRATAPKPQPRTAAARPARPTADRPAQKAKVQEPSTTGSIKPNRPRRDREEQPAASPAPAPIGAPAGPPSISNLFDAFANPEKQRGR